MRKASLLPALGVFDRNGGIETAIWAFIRQMIRAQQNTRDIEIINRNVDRLNTEALDVLTYQAPLPYETG
jgi:hypothetical protein